MTNYKENNMESIINSICEAYIIIQVIGIIGFIIIVKMIFNNKL